MGTDTIADIIISIRNANMDRKRETTRKQKIFLVSSLRYKRNRKRPYSKNILNLKWIITSREEIDIVS
ncbi:hypothetical protein CsSME_00030312 [Camellia sinensis var. sinensis]